MRVRAVVPVELQSCPMQSEQKLGTSPRPSIQFARQSLTQADGTTFLSSILLHSLTFPDFFLSSFLSFFPYLFRIIFASNVSLSNLSLVYQINTYQY